jgi:hypothetical protein
MPTYRPAKYGIQLSEALAEAAAIAPADRAIISVLEFSHPSASAIRITDHPNGVIVTHEATAPLGPSGTVVYYEAPVTVSIPEESPNAASPRITITLSMLNSEIRAALEATRSSLLPWTVTERLYASDDLTAPARMPPLTLEVQSVEMGGGPSATITCGFGEPAQRAVPRITFRSSQYPGLQSR